MDQFNTIPIKTNSSGTKDQAIPASLAPEPPAQKFQNVYVIGVFDLFHRGHLELLRNAKGLGQRLIVAINGDEMVSRYKRRPFFNEQDRLDIIKACRYVDEAFIIRDFDNKAAISQYNIDAIVHGNDWERTSYLEQIRVTEDYLAENNIALVLLPYTQGVSTSALITQIKNA